MDGRNGFDVTDFYFSFSSALTHVYECNVICVNEDSSDGTVGHGPHQRRRERKGTVRGTSTFWIWKESDCIVNLTIYHITLLFSFCTCTYSLLGAA
jgi:hypothetical protein